MSLEEAVQFLQQARHFETECRQKLQKLQGVAAITQQMVVKSNSRDELDAIHSRWTVVQNNVSQWANKLDKLVGNWQSFDDNANKLEVWVDNSEKLLGEHSVNLNTPQVDKLEAELSKLKAFNNEISEQQAKLIQLTQVSDKIGHGTAIQGGNAVKTRVNELKGRITNLAEATRGRINEISDAIMSRQEFDHKLSSFTTWMSQLRMQSGDVEQISSDKVDAALQKMHALVQEHSEKSPLFNTIYDEVKTLAMHSNPEEAKILNETYTTLVNSYQQLQHTLEHKKSALSKWLELLNWHDEASQQVKHIQYQLENNNQKLQSNDIEKCMHELDDILSKLEETWKTVASVADATTEIQIRDKATSKPITATALIRDLEVKAVNLKSQLASKMDVIQKVDTHWNHFRGLQSTITENLKKISNAVESLPQEIKDCDQLEIAIQRINDTLMDLHKLQGEKDHLHEASVQLMKEDQVNANSIQNIVTGIDEQWDSIDGKLKQNKGKFLLVKMTWKDITLLGWF